MNEELKILYEDAELLVCHKPAGIPVQSAKTLQRDIVSMLNNHLAEAKTAAGSLSGKKDQRRKDQSECPSVYVVHRLDQPVEGVLVFAKTKRAAAELSRQVSDGSMRKLYQAVCCVRAGEDDAGWQAAAVSGRGDERKYSLVDHLVKDGRTNTSFVAKQDSRDAKRAELSFRVLGKKELGSSYLLTEIELKTGRHHQIRVQMAHAGLPLYGDRKYNEDWQAFLTESDRALLSGKNAGDIPLALCAVSLTFRHPASGKRMEFETTPQAEIFSSF